MISSPFTYGVDNAPSDVQLKLIDLKSDMILAEHFKSVSLLDFDSSLKEENFPLMRRYAQKMLVLFGSIYRCEQKFSVMKLNKSKNRSSLTDGHCQLSFTYPHKTFNLISMQLFKPNTD